MIISFLIYEKVCDYIFIFKDNYCWTIDYFLFYLIKLITPFKIIKITTCVAHSLQKEDSVQSWLNIWYLITMKLSRVWKMFT